MANMGRKLCSVLRGMAVCFVQSVASVIIDQGLWELITSNQRCTHKLPDFATTASISNILEASWLTMHQTNEKWKPKCYDLQH
jgi:hypothetical protein